MNTFLEIFRGYPNDIQANVNAMARKRNLNIISVSSCFNQGTLYVTVVFEKRDND
jgi:hypothetical protein